MSGAHEQFVTALIASGWEVVRDEPYATSTNPRVAEIHRDRTSHLLLIYAWRITGEGAGRRKAGRSDLDFRVQTTRSQQDGPLEAPPMHTTLGLGWESERGVFGAFDPWIKRFTKWSASVHFTKALLDAAARDGWATEDREDGPEVAFLSSNVDRYLEWSFKAHRRVLLAIEPGEFTRNDQEATITVDPLRDRRSLALRPGDHLVVLRQGEIEDPSIWKVLTIDAVDKVAESGRYRRIKLSLGLQRTGVIKDMTALGRVLR